jgi:hypothetical protein
VESKKKLAHNQKSSDNMRRNLLTLLLGGVRIRLGSLFNQVGALSLLFVQRDFA